MAASTSHGPFNFDAAVAQIREGQSVQDATTQLLDQLTTSEKLSMLTGPRTFWGGLKDTLDGSSSKEPYVLGSIKRLEIPGILFCDGPRGVVLGEGTCFPIAMARGATWDTALEARVGEVMAAESRANAANTSGAVCINLPRHPAWGRIQETYGEDPVILGEFGIAITKALQENGMIACVKHFALNSMENMRFKVDVTIDDAALHEVYLQHFEMVVKEGNAMSVMSAYNSMNGEWCGQNAVLLNDILRTQWGFKYFVVSDWVFGLRDSVKSLKNGLDLEAPFSQVRHKMQSELDSGKITIEDVERSAKRLLATQLELYSRRTTPDPGLDVVLSQKHRDLAREVAARSMVLLKNDPAPRTADGADDAKQPLLPVDLSTVSKCAMIGPLADACNTGDWGSSHVKSTSVTTPYQGIKAALTSHNANATVTLTTSEDARKASEAAKQADFAIVVVGYSATDEGENLHASTPTSIIPIPTLSELVKNVPGVLKQQLKERISPPSDGPALSAKAGGDRKSLRLSAKNVALIRAVRSVQPRTLVAIIASGAVIMEEWIDSVESVLMSWYSGCEGGHALADVVFGRVDASGRLPFSIPRDEKHLPFFDAAAKKITYDKWFGQRLLDKKGVLARFPLGHGLSYSSFAVSDVSVTQVDEEFLSVQLTVTNTDVTANTDTPTTSRKSRYTVQIYGRPQNITPDQDFPPRVLLGFLPVDLSPGESQPNVTVRARTRPLKKWQPSPPTNNDGKGSGSFVLASRDVEIEVGAYAGDRAFATMIRVE